MRELGLFIYCMVRKRDPRAPPTCVQMHNRLSVYSDIALQQIWSVGTSNELLVYTAMRVRAGRSMWSK
jgi:hypothetical protein